MDWRCSLVAGKGMETGDKGVKGRQGDLMRDLAFHHSSPVFPFPFRFPYCVPMPFLISLPLPSPHKPNYVWRAQRYLCMILYARSLISEVMCITGSESTTQKTALQASQQVWIWRPAKIKLYFSNSLASGYINF